MLLVTGRALQDMIRRCAFQPSGVAKWQVEDVFKATLGQRREWLWKCCAEEYTAGHGKLLQTHAMLVRTVHPLILSNEMTLYPYIFNFYGLGKVLCCLSYLSDMCATYMYPWDNILSCMFPCTWVMLILALYYSTVRSAAIIMTWLLYNYDMTYTDIDKIQDIRMRIWASKNWVSPRYYKYIKNSVN